MKHNQSALFHTPLAGQYNAGTLENKPGCNAEQTLEALVNGELGRIRDMVGSTMSGRNQGPRAGEDVVYCDPTWLGNCHGVSYNLNHISMCVKHLGGVQNGNFNELHGCLCHQLLPKGYPSHQLNDHQ